MQRDQQLSVRRFREVSAVPDERVPGRAVAPDGILADGRKELASGSGCLLARRDPATIVRAQDRVHDAPHARRPGLAESNEDASRLVQQVTAPAEAVPEIPEGGVS